MALDQGNAVHEPIQHNPPAGARLRAARETAGLSLTQMAGETKIPVRMLTLIEAGDFAALPAKAYATGFTRSYARALGLNEQELVDDVRRELGHMDLADARAVPAFEPGDPARVPTARFAWAAAMAALVVLAAGLLLWRSYYAPAVTLPPIAAAPDIVPAATAGPVAQQPAAALPATLALQASQPPASAAPIGPDAPASAAAPDRPGGARRAGAAASRAPAPALAPAPAPTPALAASGAPAVSSAGNPAGSNQPLSPSTAQY